MSKILTFQEWWEQTEYALRNVAHYSGMQTCWEAAQAAERARISAIVEEETRYNERELSDDEVARWLERLKDRDSLSYLFTALGLVVKEKILTAIGN